MPWSNCDAINHNSCLYQRRLRASNVTNADEGFLLCHMTVFIDVCAFVWVGSTLTKSHINYSLVLLRADGCHTSVHPLFFFLCSPSLGPVPAHSTSLSSLTLVRFYVSGPSSQSSMAPDAETSKDIDLKDVTASDDCFLLNAVGFALHPPHHGAFNQTRTREIHQGPGHLHLPCVKQWCMLSSDEVQFLCTGELGGCATALDI